MELNVLYQVSEGIRPVRGRARTHTSDPGLSEVRRPRRQSAERVPPRWARTLEEAAWADNSREIQARFLAEQGTPQRPDSPIWMAHNLARMARDHVHQWTGHEPYRRADYRDMAASLEEVLDPTEQPAPAELPGYEVELRMKQAQKVLAAWEEPALGLDVLG